MILIKENNGLKKWSDMAKSFKGRSENAIKNRFNLVMQR
jgi:hypothetical protein